MLSSKFFFIAITMLIGIASAAPKNMAIKGHAAADDDSFIPCSTCILSLLYIKSTKMSFSAMILSSGRCDVCDCDWNGVTCGPTGQLSTCKAPDVQKAVQKTVQETANNDDSFIPCSTCILSAF
jgi:hypothetical protein